MVLLPLGVFARTRPRARTGSWLRGPLPATRGAALASAQPQARRGRGHAFPAPCPAGPRTPDRTVRGVTVRVVHRNEASRWGNGRRGDEARAPRTPDLLPACRSPVPLPGPFHPREEKRPSPPQSEPGRRPEGRTPYAAFPASGWGHLAAWS